jgi:hypothetical protein
MAAKSSNQAKAPIAAAWANGLRSLFGNDAKVIYVEEGSFKLGDPMSGPFATCFITEIEEWMAPAIIFRHEDAKKAAILRIQAIRPDQEKPLACWIGPYSRIRSLEQNALYWRLVKLVADATGHDKDVLHTFFKRQAFGVRVEQVGTHHVEYVPSSARATKGDFSELIEFVHRFIAENGIEESAWNESRPLAL